MPSHVSKKQASRIEELVSLNCARQIGVTLGVDFEFDASNAPAIAILDRKVGGFFDHRDPETVRWLGTRKLQR